MRFSKMLSKKFSDCSFEVIFVVKIEGKIEELIYQKCTKNILRIY